MKTEQKRWTESEGWEDIIRGNGIAEKAQLVFVFGGRNVLENSKLTDQISSWYPNAGRIFASTAGEITDTEVTDDGLAVTAVYFEKSKVEFASAKVENADDSFKAGEELSRILNSKGKLRHVIVISEGLKVNGTELVKGISSNLPPGVTVTGGLAGDGAKFEVTTVGLNKSPESGILAAVGLYGDSLKIGFGSQGGWSAFGDTLKITRSKANVLYELNGKSALSIYKNYLGENAKELPGAALLFPLQIQKEGSDPLVRTILSFDEKDGSMVFAGDMPEGASVNMMRAKLDSLIQGAEKSAAVSAEPLGDTSAEFALCVSCIGRKLVLKGRTNDELEAVRENLDEDTAITGFYSYGEIAPYNTNTKCELHNQTMTVTLLAEA